MKYDVVLIGGGLSSLVCGISLQRTGKRCLMVSGGQNALHFSSGAFGLLGFRPDGSAVERPLEELDKLPANHPYRKVGAAKMHEYVNRVKPFFASCGVMLDGDPERNSWRLTPTGTVRPSWLAMSDVTLYEDSVVSIGRKALIANIAGYLDFNTAFLAEGLEKAGVTCRLEAVALPEFERLRTSASEMRSVNIARVMDHDQVWKKFVEQVCVLLRDEDVVVLPEVFGLHDEHILEQIRESIPARVVFVGTMAPSVPGIRCQSALKTAFEQAGGEFLMGDEVISSEMDGERVLSVRTANLGDTVLEAGQCVVMDFGARVAGYCSDMTRMVFLGEPQGDMARAWNVVRRVNEAVEQAKGRFSQREANLVNGLLRNLLRQKGIGHKADNRKDRHQQRKKIMTEFSMSFNQK